MWCEPKILLHPPIVQSSLALFLVRLSIDRVPFPLPPELNQQLHQGWHCNLEGLPRQPSHIGQTFLLWEVHPWETSFQPNDYFSKRSTFEATQSFHVSSSRKISFLEIQSLHTHTSLLVFMKEKKDVVNVEKENSRSIHIYKQIKWKKICAK